MSERKINFKDENFAKNKSLNLVQDNTSILSTLHLASTVEKDSTNSPSELLNVKAVKIKSLPFKNANFCLKRRLEPDDLSCTCTHSSKKCNYKEFIDKKCKLSIKKEESISVNLNNVTCTDHYSTSRPIYPDKEEFGDLGLQLNNYPANNSKLDNDVHKSYFNDNDSSNGSLSFNYLSTSICDSESFSESFTTCRREDITYNEQDFYIQNDNKHRKFKKRKRKKEKSNTLESSLRPNYFVGIQISNPDIHKSVVEVQNSLLKANINIAPGLIDVATLHITLLVAHIVNEDQLHDACSALDQCGAILSEDMLYSPIQLSFQGLSHFSNQTLYAKVVEDENYDRLLHIGNVIRTVFSDMKIFMPGTKDLIPHLTIAKLSKMPRGKGKTVIRKIDQTSYQQFVKNEFGTQVLSCLQLLSMNKPKDQNRYYFCSRTVSFDVVPIESLDHTCCCQPKQPVLPKRNESTFPAPSFSDNFITKAVVGGASIITIILILSKLLRYGI